MNYELSKEARRALFFAKYEAHVAKSAITLANLQQGIARELGRPKEGAERLPCLLCGKRACASQDFRDSLDKD